MVNANIAVRNRPAWADVAVEVSKAFIRRASPKTYHDVDMLQLLHYRVPRALPSLNIVAVSMAGLFPKVMKIATAEDKEAGEIVEEVPKRALRGTGTTR